MISISGKTPEGNSVLAGLYKIKETHGLPLIIILESISPNTIDCKDYIYEALSKGNNPRSLKNSIEETFIELYGKETYINENMATKIDILIKSYYEQ